MKALLVADDEKAIANISEVLKIAGYDTIVYKWLLKALDNIEEIAPHLIVISTKDYPRHWKTLAQYSSNIIGDYIPEIILYAPEDMDTDEIKKAETLRVRGIFNSIEVDGLDQLREILSKQPDIFSGYLTEPEQSEISLSDIIPELKDLSKEIETVKDSLNEPISFEKTEEEEIEEENIPQNEEISETVEGAPAEEEVTEAADESSLEEDVTETSDESTAEEEISETVEEAPAEEVVTDSIDDFDVTSDFLNETDEQKSETDVDLSEEIGFSDVTIQNEEAETTDNQMNFSTENFVINEDSLKDDFDDTIYEETEAAEEKPAEEESESTEEEAENMNEESIEDKLASIMNANKADAKERAEDAGIDSYSCSFVFTNPITLAMVSGTARNYNGMTLEFTPDIPSFIMNLDAGTQINCATLKINDKFSNVRTEVMSNDSTKLYLQIKNN